MLRSEEAAAVAGVSTRVIYRLIEAGAIHYIETPAGLLRVCLNSVLRLKD